MLTATPVGVLAGWELQSSPTAVHLYDVTASHSDINIAWACGEGGAILFTSDGGATWTRQESGTTNDLYGIAFHELVGGPVVAVGADGTILRTTDMGATWTPLPSGTGATLRCVSDFGFFIVGDGGTILEGTDQGATWTAMVSGTAADLFSVSGAFANYTVGEAGTVLAYRSATGWIPRESGTSADLFGTPMFGSADYIAGDGGLILHSSNGGIDWTPLPVGTSAALRAIEFSVNNTSRLYAVGDAGVIVKTTDHGTTWGFQESGTAETLHGVFFYLNDLQGWAVGENGTILRTNDGGGPAVLAVASQPTVAAPELAIAGYPNPFRTRATLVFRLERPGRIALDLFDPSGRRAGGWHGEATGAGEQRIVLDVDPHLPPGIYVARLATPQSTMTQKMLRVR